MEQLIYYPGFEIKDHDWLKFALLYIDELNPIIPTAGDIFLTELHRKLTEETDLIKPHRPNYEEGMNATFDALDIVEKIIRNPSRYLRLFGTSKIIEKWQQPENHNYTLFEDKYTYEWEQFCRNAKLSTQSDLGIMLPKELGLIYMTILANAISESRGISSITDYKALDNLSILIRRTTDPLKKMSTAKSIINLKLPANLRDVAVDKIIKFRNRPQFKIKLNSFHQELNNFLSNIEVGNTAFDFIESYEQVWSDFSDELVQLGTGIVTLGLGIWIAISSPEITTAKYLKEVVAAGTTLSVGSLISLRNAWKKTQPKRFTRKYLADLQKIND
ncbi:MAG: hypothetical protein NT178_12465 [Proteobacteria bacterium]|nr:hypothetical protein [Pseudomonadota bacterium]